MNIDSSSKTVQNTSHIRVLSFGRVRSFRSHLTIPGVHCQFPRSGMFGFPPCGPRQMQSANSLCSVCWMRCHVLFGQDRDLSDNIRRAFNEALCSMFLFDSYAKLHTKIKDNEDDHVLLSILAKGFITNLSDHFHFFVFPLFVSSEPFFP